MNKQQLVKANINNLNQLWQQMGTSRSILVSGGEVFFSTSWPNRCWFEPEIKNNALIAPAPIIASMHEIKNQIKAKHILPVWLHSETSNTETPETLKQNGFELMLEQTAMVMPVTDSVLEESPELNVVEISAESETDIWTDVAAGSFGYAIDASVIRKIVKRPEVTLLQAFIHNHPVATALIFHAGNVVGVHQVGVLEAFRGQGIARKLMQYVINRCRTFPVNHITLQASNLGKPLYESLGFETQFKIENYQQANNIN